MKNFGVSGIGSPMDHALRFLQCVANLCDQRSDLVYTRGRPVQIEQRFWIPFCVQVLIEQYTCPGGDVERREEALIEPLAANHVQRLFSDAGHPHGKQAEGCAIRQLFAFQKRSSWDSGRGSRGLGGRSLGNRRFGISELRLPLRGGEDGAAIVNQFEKIEVLLPREGARLAYVLA